MTLDEFKTVLRGFLMRGTTLDASLDGYIRRGMRFIEANYSLHYMEQMTEVTSVPANPALSLNLPAGYSLKAVKQLQFFGTDRIIVNKVDFESIRRDSTYKGGFPTSFYLNGGVVYFNGAPQEALGGYALVELYSPYPAGNATHFLLDQGEGALLGACGLEAGNDLRNPEMIQFSEAQFQRWIKVLLNADYNSRYAGQDIRL